MTYEKWKTLKPGDKIECGEDVLTVVEYDFYGEGKELCVCSEDSIWPLNEFYYNDWELKEEK